MLYWGKSKQEALIYEHSGCHSHPAQLSGIHRQAHQKRNTAPAAGSGHERPQLRQCTGLVFRGGEPLRKAAAGILVCGDLDRAFRFAKDYWVIDGAIAAQNICLAAQELGLGAVWLGTWPQMDRVEAQQKLFALPETIVPHSIIALGYPEADLTAPRESRYEDDRVHFNRW